MSLFSGPEEHAANPPQTWIVSRSNRVRRWYLMTDGGVTIDTFGTKHEAEEAKTSGFWADLYAKETRWYASEVILNWKPYAECLAEQQRLALRLPNTVHFTD